jgi:hypothetical protein
LQTDVTDKNVEESTNAVTSSSAAVLTKSVVYIHFREIPKDGLKTNHVKIILGPERATRPGEIGAYAEKITKRKTELRSWGIEEVSISYRANLLWWWRTELV